MAYFLSSGRMRIGVAACVLAVSAAFAPSGMAEESVASEPEAPAADSLAQRFSDAELVAKVQIASIHRDIDNALSEPGMVAILGYVYSAVPQQVWKGEANSLIAFRLGLNACETKLEKGRSYLIFVRPDSFGRLQLRSCEAVVPEDQAGPLLARLDQIKLQG